MKKLTRNQMLCALLALLMCACVLLAACGEGQEQPAPGTADTTAEGSAQNPGTDAEAPNGTSGESGQTGEQTQPETEAETEPQPEKITYTVSVTGSGGSARQGAVARFYLGEEQVVMVATNAEGVATAQLLPETYTVVIDNILGETYDATPCTVSPEAPALAVQLFALPFSGEEIYAYAPAADDYVAYDAKGIDEGAYWATLTADDMTYFLFVASRGGVFSVSADASVPVSIGYYGSTSFVLTEPAVAEENNTVYLEVYDDMVGNYAFVIGVRAEQAELTACALRVAYVGDRKPTDDDMPWTDLQLQTAPTAYQKPAGTLRPFDVTGTKVQAVYNPADGYYHVNSADGAVILLNLGNNSPYMDALTTVCSNMRLGVYVYDAEGNLVSKDSYNEIIWAYDAVADGGYYPLDQTLADLLQTVGNYIGWYDASSPMYLFAEQPLVVPENAWLFACVYAQ